MAVGPNVEKLRTALSTANIDSIDKAAEEWLKAKGILDQVSQYLEKSSPQMRWAIGGETGPAIDAAFQRSAVAMRKRADALKLGADALTRASDAIVEANKVEGKFKDVPQPTPYRAPLSGATDDELQKQIESKGKEKQAAQDLADQEEQARIAHEQLVTAFGQSTDDMKQIHGEPDPVIPPPPPPPTGGPGAGGGSTPTGHAIWVPQQTSHFVITDDGHTTTHWQPPHEPTIDYVSHPPQHETNVPTGGTVDPGTGELPEFNGNPIGGQVGGSAGAGGGPGLGAAGATAGGMAAGLIGAKLTGALKGGLFPGGAGTAGRGTAASAVRGIGSTGRTGGAGTLGRSGAAAGSGTAGRSGAGQGAGRAGAGAGQGAGRSSAGGRGGGAAGRSGAGGRGGAGAGGRTGAGPSGRTGRSKDEDDGKKRELFDAGEDWVDDEGAAPGVLD